MGLLSSILDGVLGNHEGRSASPLGGVLSDLLAGGAPTGGSVASQTGGGLGGLLSQFQQAGLGHIAQSWIGSGPNMPVSTGQLRDVFGEDRVQDMARQSGMPSNDFLSQLAQHLPSAVDGMTPDGRLPESNATVSV